MDKESVYLVIGRMLISKKFAKHMKATSAEEAKSRVLKEIGSAAEQIEIESVFVQTPKKSNKRFN